MKSGTYKTILLVEDETFIALNEKVILENYGYSVIIAANGEKALEIVEYNPDIDLVLMDINLGNGIDGTETAVKILEKKDLPLIFLSSHTSREVVEKTEGITSYGYIVKDSGETVLIASIKMAFRLFDAKLKEVEKENELSAIFENTPVAMFIMNKELKIAKANRIASGFTGRPVEGLAGLRGGEALRCINALNDPDGCGFGSNCETCLIRNTILDTIETQNNHHNVEAVIPVSTVKGQRDLNLLVSTSHIIVSGNMMVLVSVEDISRQKKAEMEAREGEAKLRAILDVATAAVILIDRQGYILDANEVFAGGIGQQRTTVEGKNLWDFFPPDVSERHKIVVENVFRTGEILKTEYTLNNLWSEVTVCPVRNEADEITSVAIYAQDITERKQYEDALISSEKKFRVLFENMMDSFSLNEIVLDANNKPIDYIFLEVNPAFEKLIGLKREDVIGQRVTTFFPDIKYNLDDFIGRYGEVALNGKEIRFESYSSSSKKWLSIMSFSPGKGRFATIITDITDQKIADEKMRNAALFLEQNPEPVLRIMSDGTLIYSNPGASFLLNYWGIGLRDKIHGPFLDAISRSLTLKDSQQFEIQFADRYFTFDLLPFPDQDYVNCYGRDVTDQKHAEEALAEEVIRRKSLVEQSLDGIVVLDQNCKVYEANKQFVRMLGYTPDEVQQMHVWDWNPDYTREQILDMAEYADDSGHHVETRHIRKDGTIFDVEINSNAVVLKGRKFVLCICHDITDQKRVEKALVEEILLRKILLEQSLDGIVVLDQYGKVYEANKQFEKMLGYSHDEIKELYVWDWDHNFSKEQILELIELADDRGHYVETRQTRKDGTLIDVEINGNGAIISGKKYIMCICRDITDRKHTEEEIKRQLSEKEIILKEVHHRIKNHFQSVTSILSIQRRKMRNPDAIAEIEAAIGRVASMKVLYDKLLITEDYKELSVKSYIETLINTIGNVFSGYSQITILKQIAEFELDSKRLFSIGIIINELLTNVLKYAFDIHDTGLVVISLTKNGTHLILTVQDNGRGLPEGLDQDNTGGFGLMLVKILTQQMEGTFAMENIKGTRCILEFDF